VILDKNKGRYWILDKNNFEKKVFAAGLYPVSSIVFGFDPVSVSIIPSTAPP
jgi:hypothetical protein